MSRSGARTGEPPPMPPPLTANALDTHCHLDLMDVDVETAVQQATAVGITRIVSVGIDVATSRWQIETAERHAAVFATVAIHPNEAHAAGDAEWAAIEQLAAHPKVVAVGETGLDHFRTEPDGWAGQEQSFRRHIEIAKRVGKTLVIHDRDAHDDVLRVLDDEGAPDAVVFHCFSGDAKFAGRCADAGYYLSFAGNVTFGNAQPLRDAVKVAPLELLLVETDAPFLTPMPYRGRPNAPYLVPLTLRAIAAEKDVDEAEVAGAVTANANRAFGWSPPA